MDLISRQAAIDVLHGYFDGMLETDTVCPADIYGLFECIPSAQPESRREWYMKGYRDAQNAALHESCTDCPLYDHDRHNCPRFNRVIPRAIEEVKPRWISVEEALPDVRQWVLCQCRANIMDVLRLTDDGGWYHKPNEIYMSGFVLAWRELPEPYKEGQE